MAPPRTSTVPLLADLDPAAVALAVCEAVVTHLHRGALALALARAPSVEMRLARHGDPHGEVTAEAMASGSDLGLTTQALTTYAQRGLPVWDWTDSGMASDGALSVMAALYTCAGRPDVGGGIVDLEDEVEADDPIGVVLLATMARIRIDQGTPVSLRELAVLSGLSLGRVEHLAATDEIQRSGPGRVAPDEARRWLAARGVPGYR